MPKVTVDGQEIEVPNGATVLQACELAGKEIPRFCYHERLSIAGNCRMCLVEVKPGPPKPQASCALPATEGQEIRTDSQMVKTAREGVMEFLLINHPLDCPICDQGGECDLQDQSIAYGRGGSRYHENKRAVTEKHMGPLIKTIMTRCIHCTRCVRFSEEVAGVDEIGALYRGEDMQITTYLERAAKHELSANVIDLCPVGALTSRPYAYEARPWELKKTLGIDVSDAVGSNIRIDSRGREVLRILPRTNDDVNEEWISDKARYQVDGLTRRRLDKVWIRKGGKLAAASWDEAFKAIAKVKPGASVAAVAGDMLDCETMFAAKALLGAMGSTLIESRQTGMAYPTGNLAAVNFNTTFEGLERADAVLIVGSQIRQEAPLVNVRLRKAAKRGAKIFLVGPHWDTTYPAEFLGDDAAVLHDLPGHVAEAMQQAKKPAIILGGAGLVAGALDTALTLAQSWNLVREAEDGPWNGFNVLHFSAARMGALMLDFAQTGGMADLAKAEPKLLLSLGADEVDYSRFGGALKVYIGHHGDKGAAAADIILPASAYTEKAGTYVNTEGRVQFADKAVFAPGDAREDWTILRALADALGVNVGFDTFDQLRAAMVAQVPALGVEGLADYGALPIAGGKAKASGQIAYPVKDFYLTNPIARSSPTMQRCSAELLHDEVVLEGGGMTAFFQSIGMNYDWAWFVATIAGILLIALPLMLAVAMIIYVDRKIWAAMALRRGPNVVGPFGLLQSFADGLKVFLQETIIPSAANKGLFLIAPIITFTVALMAWAVIPFNSGAVLADINVGLLYVLAISSLGVYGVVVSGWASNSKYPFFSAMRAAAQMISYEVSIGFVLICVVLWAGTFNMNGIVEAQRGHGLGFVNGFAFNLLLFPMWVVFLISSLAETARAPFDLTEAESELVAGYQTEYSSMSFALFWLGEYANVLLMCALNAILFFGGWLPPVEIGFLYWVPGWLWLFAKIFFFFFVFSWVKATVPRFRYDQLMRLGWKIFLPLSLIFVVLISGYLMATGHYA